MPVASVQFGYPLTRLNPWYPGQMGVEGAWTDTGLRTHSTGTVFYVSPNHPGASDARDGTDPNDPLLTVQQAVDNCESYRGDVIVVMPHSNWQYSPGTPYGTGLAEEVTLDKHGVRLIGLSSASIGIPWEPATDGGTCLTITGMDCIVEGFCFTEGSAAGCNAIYAEWDGVTLWGDNIIIRHCLFDDTVDVAIELEFSWYVIIHDCHFQECDTHGIYVDPAGSGAAYVDVSNCFFQNVGAGAGAAIEGEFDDCLFRNNQVFNEDAAVAAAATGEGFDLSTGTDNLVSGNWFSCALPVPANGDYDDLNSAGTGDAWVGNVCMNGLSTTNPT